MLFVRSVIVVTPDEKVAATFSSGKVTVWYTRVTPHVHIISQNLQDEDVRSTEVTFDVMEWAFTADVTNERTGSYIYT